MDINYLKEMTRKVVEIDSPTGFCQKIRTFLQDELSHLGYSSTENRKGNVIVQIKGMTDYTVGLSAHVDTLGAMVKSINGDGTLEFSVLGGLQLPTIDGEYCRIYTRSGEVYTGTFLSNSPSSHVYNDASNKPRNEANMSIRLDELVHSKKDVTDLGICNGDMICIDPKFTITKSEYIKSRFLDDKACVGVLLTYLKYLKDEKITLNPNLTIIFSTYEEVGYGGSQMPEVDELLALDMACVGSTLEGNEEKVTICAKDSSGPYDYDMITKMIAVCKKQEIQYAVDLYPYYGSDASASLRAGNDIKAGLIGPGVHASHGMERTHLKGLLETYKLLKGYLE